MNIAYNDQEEGQPIEEVFDEEEVKCLQVLNKKYEGKTQKQKNQGNPKRTKWAAWADGWVEGVRVSGATMSDRPKKWVSEVL